MSQSAQLQFQQNSVPELTSSNPYLEGGKDDDAPSTSSLDSDDLHETRPNRWRGHPSTWKDWTESDRRTWAALENVRRGDLSVHLFNAFALRRGFRVGPDVDLPEVRLPCCLVDPGPNVAGKAELTNILRMEMRLATAQPGGT